jgi:hypothetical protein
VSIFWVLERFAHNAGRPFDPQAVNTLLRGGVIHRCDFNADAMHANYLS